MRAQLENLYDDGDSSIGRAWNRVQVKVSGIESSLACRVRCFQILFSFYSEFLCIAVIFNLLRFMCRGVLMFSL